MTDAIEVAAEAVYDLFEYDEKGSKPEWVSGGNSLKQDEARKYSNAAITAHLAHNKCFECGHDLTIMCPECAKPDAAQPSDYTELKARLNAAEGKYRGVLCVAAAAAIEALEARVAGLENERDHYFYEHGDALKALDRQIKRAETAEAEAAKLRGLLSDITTQYPLIHGEPVPAWIRNAQPQDPQ